MRIKDRDSSTEFSPSGGLTSENVGCMWPTWSPNGSRLAYVRFELESSGGIGRATIQVADADGTATIEAHHSEGVPIYFNWSPDGRRLAVLIQRGEALELEISELADPARTRSVIRGAPLYFAWHADSSSLLATVGSETTGSRLVWIDLESGEQNRVMAQRPSEGFRTPSWSSRLGSMTVAIAQGETQAIGTIEAPGADFEFLCPSGIGPAFGWSPSGEDLAVASRSTVDGPYDGLSICHLSSRSLERVSDALLLAFFWCNDRQIAYVTGPVGDRVVGVRVVDVGSGNDTEHGFIRPSRDVLQLFSHFDQYAESARIVSPSGAELLFAASRAKEQENGSVPTVRQILVRPLTPADSDQVVGRGRIAVWRPMSVAGL